MWGLAAALVLVVGATFARTELRYDADGFTLRVGWTGLGAPDASDHRTLGARSGTEAPWSADLASLEDELRRDLPLAADSGTARDAAFGPRDEGQFLESERRQQQEFALWFTQFARENDMQRRADQARMQQELGTLEGVADYLVRVSQR